MFGQRLKLARRKAGLTLQDLADRTDPKVSLQAISKYETGKMMPSSAVLVGLAKALDVSLDFLMGGQVSDLEHIEFRKRSRTSAQERAMAEAVVVERLEQYLAVEDILAIEPPSDAFAELRCDGIKTREEIEAKANEVRNTWKLGLDPIPSMCALLEERGIKVLEEDLPENINGLAGHARRQGRPDVDVIVVSRHATVERKRFTLAHELAHRIIRSTDSESIKLEPAMNHFAGAFLVPRDHLIEEAGRDRLGTTYHEIIRLKRTYGVSAVAMLMRLQHVGILPETAVRHAFRTFARSWRKTEPKKIDKGFADLEKPFRYKTLVWRALGDELISPIRGAQLLGKPLEAIEEQIRGPRSG